MQPFGFAFNNFASRTPLHGFALLATSYRRHELVFWFTLISISVVMMSYQTVNLILTAQTQPTYSTVAPMINKTFSLARTTLCVQYNWTKFKTLYWTEMRDLLQAIPDTDIILLRNQSKDSETPTLSGEIVVPMLTFYGSFGLAEWAFIDNDYNTLSNETIWETDAETMETILDFVTNNNVSMSKLWQTVVYSACMLMETTATVSVKNTDWRTRKAQKINETTVNMCVADRVTFLDYNSFCLKIHSKDSAKSLFSFSFPTDYVEFQMQPQLLFPNFEYGDFHMFIDLEGKEFIHSMSDSISINPGNIVHAYKDDSKCSEVSIDGDYQLYNSYRKPCSSDISQLDCIIICNARNLQEVCQCWPTIFNRYRKGSGSSAVLCAEIFLSNSSQNLSSCLSDYTETRATDPDVEQADSSKLNDCTSKCSANCRHLKYFIQPIEDKTCPNIENVTSIHLEVHDFAYIFAIEQSTTTWESFLSDLGGITGVWLGGSIIAFVQIPFYLGKVIVSALIQRKANKESSINIGIQAYNVH